MGLFQRFRVAIGLAIGLCIGIAGTTFAASNSNEIKFCVNKTTGVVRMIAKGRCSSREKLIVVNQRGIQGLPGEQGAPGLTGPANSNGLAGANGTNGANGANGANGTNGSFASLTCAQGGSCSLGDIGPGGGIVFYKANTGKWWGKYLEVAPVSWAGEGATSDPVANWCDVSDPADDRVAKPIPGGEGGKTAGSLATDLGMGWANSDRIARHCATGAATMARMHHGGGKSDWYLPTSDELAELCAYFGETATSLSVKYGILSCTGILWGEVDPVSARGRLGGFRKDDAYWTSTEHLPDIDCGFVGLVNYLDCAYTISMTRNEADNFNYLLESAKTITENRVRPIRAFG
jgi:hypothetical protein